MEDPHWRLRLLEGMTEDPLQPELDIAAALRLTASPPAAWIEAAIAIPATLADLDAIDRLVEDAAFRAAFAADARRALADAGLEPSPPLVHAVRERLSA